MMLMDMLNAPGAPLTNWREIIKAVDEEFGKARSSEKRGALLEVFKSTMDIVESKLDPSDLSKFQEARAGHYKIFILQECMVGTNVSVEDLYAVTEREIAAGRMSPDHSQRQLAVKAMAEPHLTRAELQQMATGQSLKQSDPWWKRTLTMLRHSVQKN